jgi:iron complex transport system substrate-binding protein
MVPGSSIAPFGAEKILQRGEAIDVYIGQLGLVNPGISIDSIRSRPGYTTIKAVRNNRILLIDEKIISSPTFRYLSGIREIAAFLYPGSWKP